MKDIIKTYIIDNALGILSMGFYWQYQSNKKLKEFEKHFETKFNNIKKSNDYYEQKLLISKCV